MKSKDILLIYWKLLWHSTC